MREPYVLLFMLATKHHYRDVIVSRNEVLCSPDEETKIEKGRPVTLQTAVGIIDAKETVSHLPEGWEPDLIVVKLDASLRQVPKNLAAFSCPKVLIIGAPHQFFKPLTNLLDYLESESFDLIVSDHDRHHLHWFRRNGHQRVHWIPGLNFRLCERPVRSPSLRQAIFVGQIGAHHPYRKSMFEYLLRSGLPVTTQLAPPNKAADLYASSSISLNGSLNGDLNLRVFEILGAGGLLLTDRISPDSGLQQLFTDGKDLVLYDGCEDLQNKVKKYLENEDEALAIRRSGQARLLKEHSPDLKRHQFLDLVFEERECPLFALNDKRYQFLTSFSNGSLREEISQYEFLQELHISAYRIIAYAKDFENVLSFAQDLPRLELRSLDKLEQDYAECPLAGLHEEHVLILDGSEGDLTLLANLAQRFVGRYIIALGAFGQESKLGDSLRELGFDEVEGRKNVFKLSYELAAISRWQGLGTKNAILRELLEVDKSRLGLEELIFISQVALSVGDLRGCLVFLYHCISLDRSLVDVYVAIAEIHCQLGEIDEAYIALNEARRIGEIPGETVALWEEVSSKVEKLAPLISKYEDRCQGGTRLACKEPLRVLVYTNLFPPQEMGGYGRKMWEFAYELKRRGHELYVLTGDAPYLYKEPQGDEGSLEPFTRRHLKLFGKWANGSSELTHDGPGTLSIVKENQLEARRAIHDFKPDCCLMGNLDLIGDYAIPEFTSREIPVVQCMGNFTTGWLDGFTPDQRWFRPGPASECLRDDLINNGFDLHQPNTLYPGARIDHFYRHVLPSTDIPRIAFAGLLMEYKGPHTLVEALCQLHKAGLQFEATIAGDSTDQIFVRGLKSRIAQAGLEEQVLFPGFLNRSQLIELFCKSNILAFPSIFEEPFGISQVEAMASGLAVIASGRGGSKEIIRDEVDGLHFEGGNIEDLARKIALLISDPERWTRLAEAGRERAMQFSIPATVDKIEELFNEMRLAALT